jgi:hypothetical protein
MKAKAATDALCNQVNRCVTQGGTIPLEFSQYGRF